ncbi:MAG: restriction endonuclease subunit S [Acidobacteria bacterium]|nr:MAG: restriction endonuclease subunit S [Acidobacteriota bacterium]
MKYSPYPKYKPSGMEWLGQIPEHWQVRRLAIVASKITNGYVGPTRDILVNDGVRYLQSLHIKNNKITFHKEYFVEPEWSAEHGKSVLREGDILIVQTGDIGQVAYVPKEFAGCNCHALIVVSLRSGVSGRFVAHFLNSSDGFNRLKRIETGALHPHLNCGLVRDVPLPRPPIEEQLLIAERLDSETGKIDRLVEKKQTLIKRLKEKREALISRTVTRGLPPEAAPAVGLNPCPDFKSSGTESLREIPAHWTVKPLMHLTDPRRPIMYGIVLPGPNVQEGVPIVKGGDIKPGRLKLELLSRTTKEIEAGYLRSRLRPGDLVFSIRGSIGDSEAVPPELEGANLTQDAARVAPSRETNGRWLLYALSATAILQPLTSLTLGAAIRGVNIRDLKRAKIPVPPASEQRALADYLDSETANIDRLVDKIEAAIERLQEYRSALITAAVTGNIDVRDEISSQKGN